MLLSGRIMLEGANMTNVAAKCIREQPRFWGIFEEGKKFEKRVPLVSSMMHGDEKEDIEKALKEGNVEENIEKLEKEIAAYIGTKEAVALGSGSDGIHMALKLAAEKLYGSSSGISTPNGIEKGGSLAGIRVFCSDFTTAAMVNPIIYEGGEPVFIDSCEEDWGMDPEVLEIAFRRYPDVKIVIMNHPYGFPGQVKTVKRICEKHGALLIEDASESFGARVDCADGKKESLTGSIGDYGVLDFSEDRIITGSTGGMLLTNDCYSYRKVRHWTLGSMAAAPWYQHEELGYNYRMNGIAAGIISSQFKHIDEHIKRKKEIYEKYCDRLEGGLMYMNPVGEDTKPNYWISCVTCDSNIQFMETRSERCYTYTDQHGTASPMEIYDALEAFGAQSRPVYKPMSMQPVFRNYDQVTLDGCRRGYETLYNDLFWDRCDVAKEKFNRCLCLPSDIRMTDEEQERVIDIVYACFDKEDLDRRIWVD